MVPFEVSKELFGEKIGLFLSQLGPLGIVAAGILGSPHCAGMCGGLVTSIGKDRRAVIRYHLGRLLSYSLLGALAGGLGKAVLQSPALRGLGWIAGFLLFLAFTALAFQVLRGRSPHLFRLPRFLNHVLFRRLNPARIPPEAVGGLSALLPCGWLHAFLLGAVLTENPGNGALVLSLFWVGTLPALTFFPLLAQRILGPVRLRAPQLSAFILIGIGTLALAQKIVPDLKTLHSSGDPSQATASCHSVVASAGIPSKHEQGHEKGQGHEHGNRPEHKHASPPSP